MLNGSEISLNNSYPDHLAQASHSMRDCVAQIIEELAPTEVIKQQPWFIPEKNVANGVTRRYRIRYMVYGSGENIDETNIDRLDEFIDNSLTSLNLSMEKAHNHSDIENEIVKLSIDLTRFHLLELLNRYDEYWKK